MTDPIIWQDPPEDALLGAARGRYKAFARALRENPQRWALLPGPEKKSVDSAKGTAMNIRSGRVQGFAKNLYETAVDGTKIFVRYIGPPGESEPEVEDESGQGDSAVHADSGRGAMIRQWARGQGKEVGDKGRLPQSLIDAFDARPQ